MKILFIVHRFHPNLFFPIKSLLIHGHQVQMIVPKVDIYDNLIEDHSDLKPIQIIENDLSFDFVLKILDELEPDLILQRHFERKWKYFSFIAFFKGIKCIAYDQSPQIGHSFIKQKSRPLRRFLRGEPLYKFTPVLHKGVQGIYNEPFSTYIPFPIELIINNFSEKQYCPNGLIRFLCIGKLGQRRKNHLHLLSALEEINLNCSLTFVGAGPGFKYTDIDYFNELKLRTERTTIIGGVNILMDLPHDEMRNTYKDFDVLVLPADKEPHGQVILEGLAAGLAVISTDNCGAAGYIQNGYNGLIYKRNSIVHLKDKIRYLTEDTERIMELSTNALEYTKTVHSGLKFVQSIESL